jgi:hypothetical protein
MDELESFLDIFNNFRFILITRKYLLFNKKKKILSNLIKFDRANMWDIK